MQLSEHWLREWVDPGLTLETLAEQLTQAGLEVEGVLPAAPEFSGVVVGKIVAIQPHPDAARLWICQVEAGQHGRFQVVCGAANAAVGMKAPFAMLGACLPGDKRIGRATLRGVESQGMLCSARELGLEEYGTEGLWPLTDDAPVGADIRAWLHLGQRALTLKLTPNRGDCLSVLGVARELAAINHLTLRRPAMPSVPAALPDVRSVSIEDPRLCSVYSGRVVRHVRPDAKTPLWMQERLRLSGLRSLGPLVDVTNYVMLELGQPMHAFDLARLKGSIHVRHARPGERLLLLDGRRVELMADDLLIADDSKPLALAGIMGGQDSSVSADTRDVFLEAAHFSPLAVAGRARQHGLHTDSSHRFERGVDPALPMLAMERATALLCEIAGGVPGPTCVAGHEPLPRRVPVKLRSGRVQALLGVAPTREQVEDIFARLEIEAESAADGWLVLAPSHRFDLELEADFIEEIARLIGYEHLPEAMPVWPQRLRPLPEDRVPVARFKQRLVDRGYQEAITFSFIAEEEARVWGARPESAMRLINPISEDLAVMRQSLWPSLSRVLVHNLRRQNKRVRIFEVGSVYSLQHDEVKEENLISGICYGGLYPEQWAGGNALVGFHDLKSDVEALLNGCGAGLNAQPSDHPALHPGRSLRLMLGERCVGHYGMLHPRLQTQFKLENPAGLFELKLGVIEKSMLPKYREIPQFPSIRRDLAVIVDEYIPMSDLLETVREAGGERLHAIFPFDVYQGKGVEKGRKSVALGLIFQDDSRTLTDIEAETILQAVQAALKNNHGAILRE